MFSRKCRNHIFNGGAGGGGSLLVQSLVNYSTATKIAPSQNGILTNYLVKSLGFSKEVAISTSSKVTRLKPLKYSPNSVINYFENLGMSKSQLRTIVSLYPNILFWNVERSLAPKIKVLEELGLSGLDIVRIFMVHKCLLVRGVNSYMRPRIECYKELFDTDIRVAAFKRYALRTYKVKHVKQNLLLLQSIGFTCADIVKLMAKDAKNILFLSGEKLQDTVRRVENDLGIPRVSAFFYYGMYVLSSYRQSNIDAKFETFKSFGWSDAEILALVRNSPLILCMSPHTMRRSLDCFMKEFGYSSEYLVSHPVLLALSLERRVKPRIEVQKVLIEMNLNKGKTALYTLLIKPEAKFLKDHVLKYKDILPNMCAEYLKMVGKQKMEQLGVLR